MWYTPLTEHSCFKDTSQIVWYTLITNMGVASIKGGYQGIHPGLVRDLARASDREWGCVALVEAPGMAALSRNGEQISLGALAMPRGSLMKWISAACSFLRASTEIVGSSYMRHLATNLDCWSVWGDLLLRHLLAKAVRFRLPCI